MKTPFFVILLAIVLTGCGLKDPIDRIVKEESANPHFGNGMLRPLLMPATASPSQVVARIVGNLPILEIRQVYIPSDHADAYTAALVAKGDVRGVVLLRCENDDQGWWTQVYWLQ